uniref:bifunctional DNA primase/polymerase n=1 Tax=Candidatus Frankia nodulisporulans TaxID=2060052 RepID=UPI00178161DF
VVTGSGGAHLYYRHPGVPLLSAADVYGLGLDVRGDGGMVVAPPSRHPNGHRYAWVGGAHGLCREALAEYLADWPVGHLAQPSRPPDLQFFTHSCTAAPASSCGSGCP